MSKQRTEADNYAFLVALIEKTGDGKPKFKELVGQHPNINKYMDAYHWFNSIKTKAGLPVGTDKSSTPTKAKATSAKTPPSKLTGTKARNTGGKRGKKQVGDVKVDSADGEDQDTETPSKKRKMSDIDDNDAPESEDDAEPSGEIKTEEA